MESSKHATMIDFLAVKKFHDASFPKILNIAISNGYDM